jgi:hypothetical protein
VKPPAAGSNRGAARPATRKQGNAEVVAALAGLGYSIDIANISASPTAH